MSLISWTIFLSCITCTLEACTKTPDCDAAQASNLRILDSPRGPATYSPPNPISLQCRVSGDNLDTVRWIRNNSDGNSTYLNSSTPIERVAPELPLWNAKLTDSPPEDKFPHTYQCIAFGKCCEEIKSPHKTVNFLPVTTAPTTGPATPTTAPEKVTKIHEIRTDLPTYYGYGKIKVQCTGLGDNASMVHWIRRDKDGHNISLNSTEVEFNNVKHISVWKAELLDRPANLSKFPYDYLCVLENECCPTKISSWREIAYSSFFSSSCPFLIVFKPIKPTAIPSKRSVKFAWIYDDPDPEDTGFSIEITNVLPLTKLNITTREYAVYGLDPYKSYEYRLQILYGTKCTTRYSVNRFMTLADIPGTPRNVTMLVKENTLNVSWALPEFPNGKIERYVLFWKRTFYNDKYKQKNVTSTSIPFIIKGLDGFTSYSVKVQAVNQVGIGNFSEPVTATTRKDPNKNIQIHNISSDTKTYTGFGKVQVLCIGEGDSATKIHWLRTDKDGNNVTLNTTSVYQGNDGIWRAELLDRPVKNSFPNRYKCVMDNRCCQTEISLPLTISYLLPRSVCPNVESIKKPIKVNVIPDKRSVEFTWTYGRDPEDTGFRFQVDGAPPAKTLNISERKHTVQLLDSNKKYSYNYTILYGKGCQFLVSGGYFTTLPDYPSKPENVTVVAEENTLNVSWLPPKYPNGEMKHYILSWKRSNGDKYKKKNLTSNPYVIGNLDYFTSYSIKLQAVNNVGIGKSSDPVSAQTQKQRFPAETSGGESSNSGAIAGGVVGVILFLILVLILLLFLRRRRLRKEHNKSVRAFHTQYLRRLDNPSIDDIQSGEEPVPDFNAEPLPEKSDVPDEVSYIVLLEDWEIAPDNIKLLDKKLGGGQFGIVKQGLFRSGKGDPEIVAVKTVKNGASESDLSDLMSELKILKEVNKVPHPNVIRLIGGCSIAGKLHVVTEFCPGGSLRHLLLNSRVYPSAENSSNYINLASTLNHRQLLKIAADISNGMVHLSSQKFVHRDLAARNILIGEDNMAKVSDFGLARDVTGAEEYIRNNQNLLPVKWMALESLLHGRFTTASDVWSYGVLLHEVATLGEEPYKHISPYNIVSHVGSGCRMPQPPQCSDEVYEIMTNCWKVEPTERPSFEDIRNSLQDMLVDNEKSYINLAHIVDEGPLTTTTTPTNLSIKDGSIRYTTA